MDSAALQRRDPAGGLDIDRKVHGHCSGMKQIQGPQVDGSPGEVGSAGRFGHNHGPGWQEVDFVHFGVVMRHYMPPLHQRTNCAHAASKRHGW